MTLLSLTTQAQCSSIAVEVDTNESCAPGIFEFVAKNAPSGSFFAWDFGKGSIPGNDTFKLIEPNARSISLTLYIALATGKQCTTVVKKIAEVYKRPTPSASINKKIFCSTSEEFEFTDLTSNSVFRIWTIEGINYGDTANIKKGNFSSDGKKNISLMVEDSHGCRGFKSYRDITEVVSAKDVKIKGVNNRGCVNSDLSFSVESGFSPTQIKSISWSFSGGLPVKSTEVSPRNIRYAKGGNYDVSVELTTKNGCTYSDLKKGIAQPKDSLILNVAISDSSICTTKGVDVRVLNKSTSSQLFFNVPNFDTSLIDSLSTSQRKFTFTESGVFDLFLTHVDSFCTSHYLKKAFVSAKKVQARMNASNHYGCKLPFLAKFSDTSFFSEPGNVVYRWMVYDSLGNLLKTSNKKSFEYLVKDSGYYDVDLTVRHENGCADSFYRSELIRADSIRIDYTPISEVVCLNQEVIIQNSSLPSSYNVSDVFEWRLYRSSDATTAIDSSFISRPTFKAKFKGSYDLKVVAYNALGCRQTDSRKFVFEVGEPKAGLRVENPNQCPSDTFSLISSNDPRNGSYINRWIIYNEKDTLRSTGENPIVEIDSPGIYNVTYHISIFGLCRDTVTKKDLISINGIQSVINISTNRTCSKIPVSPKANVRNYINPSTDTVFKYQWDVFPNSGYSIDNDTIKEPTIYFQQDGKYIIRLISQNEFGCLDTAYSDTIVSGLNMKQVFLDTAVCANAPIRFTNSSDTFINKWYYTLSPDESFTIKNNNKDTSIIWITKEGVYTFHIVASRDSLCFDTASTTLHIVSPKAEFFPIDSNLYCAPVYQRFESKSTFADTLFWDFGDGKQLKTTLSKVTTLYEQNTGSINPYSVRLIAKNKSGCADTLVKQNLVKVDGPSAKLTLSQIRGCEPLAVTFNGPVENVHKMYIDYGDGGEFGFSLDEPHYYKNNWRIIEQQYRPVILVIDKNGCQTAFKTDSTIVVKPSPTAIIGIVDSIACSKLRTRYYYLGNEATSWFWDFEGDGKPDGSSATGVHKYQTPGRYNMTLINMNTFGCSDTAMSPIHVVKSPQISILTD
ncbi:MAG: PKD repeat protein, partial [Bacteroidia bacterium]